MYVCMYVYGESERDVSPKQPEMYRPSNLLAFGLALLSQCLSSLLWPSLQEMIHKMPNLQWKKVGLRAEHIIIYIYASRVPTSFFSRSNLQSCPRRGFSTIVSGRWKHQPLYVHKRRGPHWPKYIHIGPFMKGHRRAKLYGAITEAELNLQLVSKCIPDSFWFRHVESFQNLCHVRTSLLLWQPKHFLSSIKNYVHPQYWFC